MLELDDFFGEVMADSVFGSLIRLAGRLLRCLFLLVASPYLLLRGWLHVRPRTAGLRELYQQGKQAGAHDMQYVLAAVVCLPLGLLVGVAAWKGGQVLAQMLSSAI